MIQEDPMLITLGLLACVKSKKEGFHKARDLYESNLFKLGVKYLDLKTDDWYILSAKYGLVHQNQHIKNYNESLNSKNKIQRLAWSKNVWYQLLPKLKNVKIIILIEGTNYRKDLTERIDQAGIPCWVPLASMGIGNQMQWLKEEAQKK